MSTLKAIWKCMFAPRLIKIYGTGPVEKAYESTTLEAWGDQIIRTLYVFWKIGVYTSPLVISALYQRGYFTADGLITLTKFVTGIGVILVVSYCFRSIGRAQNATYIKFIEVLEEVKTNLTVQTKQKLQSYEFEFVAWPVEFDALEYERGEGKPFTASISKSLMQENVMQYMLTLPFRIIAFMAIHTFGIRLIYPGSLGMLQKVLEPSLLQGRSRLIEVNRGCRYKLLTKDKNEIDTMFVDKRNVTENGNILVICCEGNAGFYEIGIMTTPIEAEYSVLGWNHPGFGGSTGQPYPSQERNAIDAVLQFAIHKLGFPIGNIVLFGWSIGGYTSSFAAMNYPDIKGIVLDATFDDVLPLALNHMPSWWEPIVKIAIREYVNLNVFEHLTKYPGPVLLIRRTEDEVICLQESDISSNLGNRLLIKLLCHRYPCIMEDTQIQLLNEYLAYTSKTQDELVEKLNLNETLCQSLLQNYISEFSKSYPMKIGEDFTVRDKNQMALFLARRYMKDFHSNHCNALPAELFQMPWDISVESDFIFT